MALASHAGADMNSGTVDVYWIPLGAGASSVRGNGIVYEALTAAIHRRPRCDLYHSALEIQLLRAEHAQSHPQ